MRDCKVSVMAAAVVIRRCNLSNIRDRVRNISSNAENNPKTNPNRNLNRNVLYTATYV